MRALGINVTCQSPSQSQYNYPMTRFFLFRHGETVMNTRPHLVGGRSNHTPLTPRGESQAIALGKNLAERHFSPDVVLHSGAVRARNTGELAVKQLRSNAQFEQDERLQEIGQGDNEGLERQHVYTPEIIDYLEAAGLDGHLPTGESMRDVQNRMWEVLVEQNTRHPKGTIVIFGHGLAIRAIAGKILGYTKRQILYDLSTDNCSETRIDMPTLQPPQVLYVGKTIVNE